MNEDEIRVGPTHVSTLDGEKAPPRNNFDFSICEIATPWWRNPCPIYFHYRAKREILSHAAEITDREVGGALVGGVYLAEDRRQVFFEVTGAVRGDFTVGSAVRLTFTPDTWSQLANDAEQCFPGKRIIGWYHTHPGWGVFLSEQDKFIQNHYFNLPGQLALVVDGIRGVVRFFVGSEEDRGGIRASEEFVWDRDLYAAQPPAAQLPSVQQELGTVMRLTEEEVAATARSGPTSAPGARPLGEPASPFAERLAMSGRAAQGQPMVPERPGRRSTPPATSGPLPAQDRAAAPTMVSRPAAGGAGPGQPLSSAPTMPPSASRWASLAPTAAANGPDTAPPLTMRVTSADVARSNRRRVRHAANTTLSKFLKVAGLLLLILAVLTLDVFVFFPAFERENPLFWIFCVLLLILTAAIIAVSLYVIHAVIRERSPIPGGAADERTAGESSPGTVRNPHP